jgi:hypothetical protein
VAQPVKLEDGTFSTQVSCEGTVIYPGGEEDYKKQIMVKLANESGNNGGWFSSLSSMFTKPMQITKICLFDRDELLWESEL